MAFATTFGCFYVYLDDAAVHCFLRLFFGTAKTNAGTNAGPVGTAKTNAGTNAGPVARIFHVFRYSTDFVISATTVIRFKLYTEEDFQQICKDEPHWNDYRG